MDKLQDFLKRINEYCETNDIYNIDDLSTELYDELCSFKFEYITTNAMDEHRWYVLGECVYRLIIDQDIYYVGCWEIKIIKNECMSVEDCANIIRLYRMEEFSTVGYRKYKDKT